MLLLCHYALQTFVPQCKQPAPLPAAGRRRDYQAEGAGVAPQVPQSGTGTQVESLPSRTAAPCPHPPQVGVEVAEQEWLVVFGGYLLKQQRLLGDGLVQRLKAEDLQRCHDMGGFDTPVGGTALYGRPYYYAILHVIALGAGRDSAATTWAVATRPSEVGN